MLKVTIESLDVPAHMIEASQFRSGKQNRVQQRGDQAATAKPISINENHPDRESAMAVGVLDLTQIITLAESTQNLRTHVFLSGNDEVGLPAEDLANPTGSGQAK